MNLTGRPVLDTIKILETREVDGQAYEVCANARANYDEDSHELGVELESFLRRFEMRGKDKVLHPPWLPRNDRVRTHTSLEEAPDAAKEIFDSWAVKVKRTIPESDEWNSHPRWLLA